MNKLAFFAVLTVLVLGIVYVYKTAERPPDTGITRTPKEYIEQLERSKAARRTGVPGEANQESSAEGQGRSKPEDQR